MAVWLPCLPRVSILGSALGSKLRMPDARVAAAAWRSEYSDPLHRLTIFAFLEQLLARPRQVFAPAGARSARHHLGPLRRLRVFPIGADLFRYPGIHFISYPSNREVDQIEMLRKLLNFFRAS